MSKAKTHERFVQDVLALFPDYEVLSFYVNNKTKVKIRDNKCGTVWMARPDNLLILKRGCPVCGGIKCHKKQITLLEKMIKKLKEKFCGLIEYVSGYIDMHKKCKFRCIICGNVWEVSPNSLLNKCKYGCPICAKRKSTVVKAKTDEHFKQELFEVNPNIETLEIYRNSSTKIKVKCKNCNNVWEAYPHHLLQGHGCAQCACNMKKTDDQFKKELFDKNPNIDAIDFYINSATNIRFKCKICEHVWITTPSHILNSGSGCPMCAKKSLEKPILEAFKKKRIVPLHDVALKGSNYNGSRMPLRVDFIIETPKGKLAIEADGRQHFTPIYGEDELKYQQEKDRHKDKYLKEHEYILIRVTSSPTKEWGFKNHITLAELLHLIEIGIDRNGNVNFDIFKPFDFNRE